MLKYTKEITTVFITILVIVDSEEFDLYYFIKYIFLFISCFFFIFIYIHIYYILFIFIINNPILKIIYI